MEEVYEKIKKNFQEVNVLDLWTRVCSSNILTLEELQTIANGLRIQYDRSLGRENLCILIKNEHITIVTEQLFEAVENNDLSLVEQLIKSGAGIDYTKKYEEDDITPIIVASGRGYFDIVKHLVENGADINFDSDEGNTAFISAYNNGHYDIAKYLVEQGSEFADNSVFYRACVNGELDFVKFLVEKGADINNTIQGYVPVVGASEHGHLEIVKFLVENGAEINLRGEGMTALMEASRNGHLEIVIYLLSKGADILYKQDTVNKMTALSWASEGGHLDIVKVLVINAYTKLGKNIPIEDSMRAIKYAAEKGDLEIIKYLIESQSLDKLNSDDIEDIIGRASRLGWLKIIEYLVEKGLVDLQEKDKIAGESGLQNALINANLDVVKYFYEKGVNTTEPFVYVIIGDVDLDVIKYLIERGEDIRKKDENGDNFLMFLAGKGHLHVIKYLVEEGLIDLLGRDKQDSILALGYATAEGRMEIMKYLIEKGVDPNASEDQYNPLWFASSHGRLEAVKYLIPFINSREIITNAINEARERGKDDIVEYLDEVLINLSNPGRKAFYDRLRETTGDPVFISDEICKPGEEYEGKDELKKAFKSRNLSYKPRYNKEILCKKLKDSKKPKDLENCQNDETILGEPLDSIPNGFFYSYRINNKKYCLPITELKNLDKCPYTRQPIPGLNRVKKLLEDVYFPKEEVRLTYQQIIADIKNRIQHLNDRPFTEITDLIKLKQFVELLNEILLESQEGTTIQEPQTVTLGEKYNIMLKLKEIVETRENTTRDLTIAQLFEDFQWN